MEKLTSRDEAEVDDFDLQPAGAGAAVVFNVAGRSELAILDLATLRLTPVPDLPGEIVGGLFYENYLGGAGLMAGAVFGRLAGASAARHANS